MNTSSDSPEPDGSVDFGRQRVPIGEKTARVAEVFHRVAARYDLMNDLMSLGTHRLLKRATIDHAGVQPGQTVLDLAGGTGDLSIALAERVGPDGCVALADINADMLSVGRDRVLDAGANAVRCVQANGERLPFADATFDCATMAFGLRNVTHRERALRDIWRTLKPGARLLVLEFSHPDNPLLAQGYRLFSGLWPTAGKAIVGDAAPYRYLVDSIEQHPPAAALALMMEDVGFVDVTWHNLIGGVVALHCATRPQLDHRAAGGPETTEQAPPEPEKS